MNSRNKIEAGLYVPPGRRSESGTSNGRSPVKNNEEHPPLEPSFNCCEDQEEDELEESPTKSTDRNISNSSSPSWRGASTSSDVSREFQNLRLSQLRNQDGRIPIKQRTIKGSQAMRDSEISDDNSSRSGFNNDSRLSNDDKNGSLETFYESNVPYIDSHCHTDFMFEQLNKHKTPTTHQGLHEWMDKYKDAFPKGFSGIIANFIKPELFIAINGSLEYDMNWIAREAQSDLYLGTTWGCHPHSVTKWGRASNFWATMDWIISKRDIFKVLAIGECGIDLHKCHSNLEDQRYVFERHVELAFKHDLTLVIHCRNGSQGRSEEECLNILEKQMKINHRYLKIHRHCYTEDWNTAQQWLKQCPDVHFGYTGAIFSFSERQIEAVRRLPLDRILLETDGPYFKPKCFEFASPNKLCLPGMAIATAQRIADIKHLELDEVLRATYNNTKRVYQIPVYDCHKKSNNRGFMY